MTTTQKKQSSGSSKTGSSGGKNKNKNRTQNKKTGFKGSQTDGALKDNIITQVPNMSAQLRLLREAMAIRAAEL